MASYCIAYSVHAFGHMWYMCACVKARLPADGSPRSSKSMQNQMSTYKIFVCTFQALPTFSCTGMLSLHSCCRLVYPHTRAPPLQKMGREPRRFDHVPRDIPCVVLIIELMPTQSVLSVISGTRVLLEFWISGYR